MTNESSFCLSVRGVMGNAARSKHSETCAATNRMQWACQMTYFFRDIDSDLRDSDSHLAAEFHCVPDALQPSAVSLNWSFEQHI
jgi:hypothetical protein